MATSGAFIYNALDGNKRDALENAEDEVDFCMTYQSQIGIPYYQAWPSCLKNNVRKTEAPLTFTDSEDTGDVIAYTLDTAF